MKQINFILDACNFIYDIDHNMKKSCCFTQIIHYFPLPKYLFWKMLLFEPYKTNIFGALSISDVF